MRKSISLLLLLLLGISCGKKSDSTKDETASNVKETPITRTVVNDKDKEELYQFIKSNDITMLSAILEKQDFIDYQFVDGQTPITMAIQLGHEEIISKLLMKSANVDMPNAYGETPLNLAIRNRRFGTTRNLIKYYDADVNLISFMDFNPLNSAILFATEDIAFLVLEAGANIHHIDATGVTSYTLAKGREFKKLEHILATAVKYPLLDKTSIKETVKNADILFFKYIQTQNKDLFKIIDEENYLLEALEIENSNKRKEMLIHLLGHNTNVNNVNGLPPLLYAIELNRLDEFNLMLERYEADINVRDEKDKTALIYAVEEVRYQFVKIIRTQLKEQLDRTSPSEYDQAKTEFFDQIKQACRALPSKYIASKMHDDFPISQWKSIKKILNCR